jgi:serine/threonine-protein kinase
MPMSDMVKLLADRYRILEQIGSGGMAIVYKAEDVKTGKPVAIKFLKPEFSEDDEFSLRFQREADAISRMMHHNIVNLLDVGYEDNHRFLVMEYVQGRTLKELIREKGRMQPDIAAQITLRILAALRHAHQNGIIHRDVKPQNILVHDDGHIKVADFGIAAKMDSETLAQTDNVIGSVHYISPEQASGKEIDVTSDIYSVGVVFYEMLTGRVPYDGETVVAVAMQHLRGAAPPVHETAPEVSGALSYVVAKAMERDPKQRYQSALDMGTDLKAAIDGTLDKVPPVQEQDKAGAVRAVLPAAPAGRKPLTPGAKRFVNVLMLTLLTILVLGSLAFGGISIYNAVINSAVAPDLTDMEVSAAVRLAQREGFKTDVIYAAHPVIPEDYVTMQTPEDGVQMHRGDTIVIYVSKGSGVMSVPEVETLLTGEAVTVLQKAGLVLAVVEREVSTEPVDTILTQTPQSGAPCAIGDTIQVTVSGGSVIMPDLTDMPEEAALEAINGAGLMPGAKEGLYTTDPGLIGRIASQKPSPGVPVIIGTVVTVWVYSQVRYQASIWVRVPESDQGARVKITYLRADGSEEEQYSAMHAQADNAFDVDVYGDTRGDALYKVYLDGEFYQDINAVLE